MMWVTNTVHEVRNLLGITPNEYFICDLIAHSQKNEHFSDSGWCTLSYAAIAKTLFISLRGCKYGCEKLAANGLILLNGNKKRVTNLWLEAFKTVQALHQKDSKNSTRDGAILAPEAVQSLHQERCNLFTENGAMVAPHNIKIEDKYNINSNSYKNEEENRIDLNFSLLKNGITNSTSNTKKNVSQKKKIPPKKKRVISPVSLFDDTALVELDYFISKFADTDYQFADLEYYRSRLRTWGNDKKVTMSESMWFETAKTFMRRDADKGNLIKRSDLIQHNGKSKQVINPVQIHRLLKKIRDSENRGL